MTDAPGNYWPEFLQGWEHESRMIWSLFPPVIETIPSLVELRATRHFRPPATMGDIEEAEQRLGVRLPEDLRQFYLASNGWSLAEMGDIQLVPIQEVRHAMHPFTHHSEAIADHVGPGGELLLTRDHRESLLLLSDASRLGYCVASPLNNRWRYAWSQFDQHPQHLNDFASTMNSLKWICHYYMRQWLDYHCENS
jgi:hypothetical protein